MIDPIRLSLTKRYYITVFYSTVKHSSMLMIAVFYTQREPDFQSEFGEQCFVLGDLPLFDALRL